MKIVYLILVFLFPLNAFCDDTIYLDSLVDAVALSQSSKKDILIVFTADWCKYCNKFKSEMIGNEILKDKIVCYVDFDTNKDIIKEYRVTTIPDFIVLHNQVEIKRKVGYNNSKEFIKWISKP
jgi:thioredoxin-related protein